MNRTGRRAFRVSAGSSYLSRNKKLEIYFLCIADFAFDFSFYTAICQGYLKTATIKDSYLATLPAGTQTITFVMSSGNSPVLTITVKGAEEVEEVETGPTYKPMAPLHSAGTVVDATKTNNKLVMGDDELEFPAVKIGGYNWIKLRDFAMYLTGIKKQFSVSYDQSTQIIDIRTGGNYQPLGDELENNLPDVSSAISTQQRLRVNGEFIDVAAYNIKGYNYFRMRDLAIILNFAIDYDDTSGMITLDLDNPYWE